MPDGYFKSLNISDVGCKWVCNLKTETDFDDVFVAT